MDDSLLDDEKFMRRAIEVATGNPKAPFGTVIASMSDGVELATGLNNAGHNPTLHGEIAAINALVDRHSSPNYSDLCLYTTAEPCPMCLSAILMAGVPRVVYGTSVATLMKLGWNQFQLRSEKLIAAYTGGGCELLQSPLVTDCDQLFIAAGRSK